MEHEEKHKSDWIFKPNQMKAIHQVSYGSIIMHTWNKGPDSKMQHRDLRQQVDTFTHVQGDQSQLAKSIKLLLLCALSH